MQLSIDGFVAGPGSEMDWMQWNWDDGLKNYVMDITRPVDTLVLGRKLAEGFIPAWKSRFEDPLTRDEFSEKMVKAPKYVFTRTLSNCPWEQTEFVHSDLARSIRVLKDKDGGDVMAYGGGEFVGSLISNNLVDEYHLFFNPTAIGKGMRIFDQLEGYLKLSLLDCRKFDCGVGLMTWGVV